MKRFMLCACFASLALGATAQSESDQSVFIRGYQIEVPTKTHHVAVADLRQYQGSYDLATGEALSLRQVGHHLIATLGNQPPRQLVAAAPDVFVSTDRQVRMSLTRQDDGEYSGYVWLAGSARTAGAPDVASSGNGAQYAQLVSFK